MNRIVTLSIAAMSLVVTACTGPASVPGRQQGYVVDSRNAIVKDPFSLCWRTGYWTPALAIAECDPSLAPRSATQTSAPRPATPVPSPTPPAAAAAAVPATPAVPAAPAVVPPPPAAATAAPVGPKRCDASISLQSDELFAFNSAALNGGARGRIDKDIMNRLGQCASVDVVLVTGHTDRLGSQQYNQALSERRAAAVRSYLSGKGVAAGKIETMGMGKTAPAKFCPDSRNQTELIACLAPNRRVTIDIKGLAK